MDLDGFASVGGVSTTAPAPTRCLLVRRRRSHPYLDGPRGDPDPAHVGIEAGGDDGSHQGLVVGVEVGGSVAEVGRRQELGVVQVLGKLPLHLVQHFQGALGQKVAPAKVPVK